MVWARTWAPSKRSTQVPHICEGQTKKKPRKSFAILLWGKCTDFLPGPSAGIKEKSVCQHFTGHGILILLHEVNLRPTNAQINDSSCEQLLKPRSLSRWLPHLLWEQIRPRGWAGEFLAPLILNRNHLIDSGSMVSFSERKKKKTKSTTVQTNTLQSLLTFIQVRSQTPEKFRESLHF